MKVQQLDTINQEPSIASTTNKRTSMANTSIKQGTQKGEKLVDSQLKMASEHIQK